MRSSVKVLVFYTHQEEAKVTKILRDLKLQNERSIVLIDARAVTKPFASKAGS